MNYGDVYIYIFIAYIYIVHFIKYLIENYIILL